MYDIYYDKDNSSNYTNNQFLSYLPILYNYNNIFGEKGETLFISEDIIKNRNRAGLLNEIINVNILHKELNEKKYNISFFLLGLLIDLSSFLDKELFNIDLYLKNLEDNIYIQTLKRNSKEFKINNYIGNFKKLIYLTNENNINIIERALNILIPYFTELINNNFYLFLPVKSLNLLKFFIRLLSYNCLLFDDIKNIKSVNYTKLVKLFVEFNLKLLYDEKTNLKFAKTAFDNIMFLYNICSLLNRKKPLQSFEISDDDINILNHEDIKDFNFFIKEADLGRIISILVYLCKRNVLCDIKYLYKFLMHFSQDISSDRDYKENIFIPIIIKLVKIDNNYFWIQTYIVDFLIKQKLLPQIKTIGDIMNMNPEIIDTKNLLKIKNYFTSIAKVLDFISNFIDKEIVLEKYFNFYMDNDSIGTEYNNDLKEKFEKFSIYCFFIYIATLIIKELLNKDFLILKKLGNIHELYNESLFLTKECFIYFEKIFIEIPKKYQQILDNKDKAKNQSNEESKSQNENAKGDLNEDLKHYYLNIVNNIEIKDIFKLSTLFENIFILRQSN